MRGSVGCFCGDAGGGTGDEHAGKPWSPQFMTQEVRRECSRDRRGENAFRAIKEAQDTVIGTEEILPEWGLKYKLRKF